MKLTELESIAHDQLEEDDTKLAVNVIKSRLVEIRKVRAMLRTLETKYNDLLKSDVSDVVEGIENGKIRF